MLLDRIGKLRPVRMVIGDPDLFDRGNVSDAQMKMLGLDRAGCDEILDVLGHAGEQELESGSRRPRLHRGLLPFRCAQVADVNPQLIALEAVQLGGNELIGVTPDRGIARTDMHVIQRLVGSGPQGGSAVA